MSPTCLARLPFPGPVPWHIGGGSDAMDRARRQSDLDSTWTSSSQHDLSRRRTGSRSDSQSSTESDGTTSIAMAIPGVRLPNAPPPLPPPRWNDTLANGVDLGWRWANVDSRLAPIKPGSSLRAGYPESRRSPTARTSTDADEMLLDDDTEQRGSALPNLRSPSSFGSASTRPIPQPERRPSSPGSSVNQRYVKICPCASNRVRDWSWRGLRQNRLSTEVVLSASCSLIGPTLRAEMEFHCQMLTWMCK